FRCLDRPSGGSLYCLFRISDGGLDCLFSLLSCLYQRICRCLVSFRLHRNVGNRGTARCPVSDQRAVLFCKCLCFFLLGSFCRPFCLKIGKFILCLSDILPCRRHTFLSLIIELVDALVPDTPRSMGNLVGGIFRRGIFLC